MLRAMLRPFEDLVTSRVDIHGQLQWLFVRGITTFQPVHKVNVVREQRFVPRVRIPYRFDTSRRTSTDVPVHVKDGDGKWQREILVEGEDFLLETV
jgi:hypothetical protein